MTTQTPGGDFAPKREEGIMHAPGDARGAVKGIIAISVMIAIACGRGSSVVPGSPASLAMTGSRPDCPLDSVALPVEAGMITQVSLAGPITNVPEFHDCQRLLPAGRDEYGPLAAIFASFRSESLLTDLRRLRAEYRKEVAVAAAVIYSWDGDYPRLGIKRGFNCLYVWRQGADWQARMISVGDKEVICLDVFDPSLPPQPGEPPLSVREVRVRPSKPDYPAVARWDADSRTGLQFIGIKCEAAWCEVGPQGFGQSQDHKSAHFPHPHPAPPPPPTPGEITRVIEIKGWYDEQRLAPARGTGAQATRITGTILPHPRLDTYVLTDFTRSWVPVAYVHLSNGDRGYKAKFNLNAGRNWLALCKGTRSECGVPDTVSCPRWHEGWWSRIVAANNDTKYGCVKRTAHESLNNHIPGTARWRWAATDEQIWVRCAQGCCWVPEMEG